MHVILQLISSGCRLERHLLQWHNGDEKWFSKRAPFWNHGIKGIAMYFVKWRRGAAEEEEVTAEQRFARLRQELKARDAADREAYRERRRQRAQAKKERARARAASEAAADAGGGARLAGAAPSDGEPSASGAAAWFQLIIPVIHLLPHWESVKMLNATVSFHGMGLPSAWYLPPRVSPAGPRNQQSLESIPILCGNHRQYH